MLNVHLRFTASQTRNNLRTVITSSDDIVIQKRKNFKFIIQSMRSFGGKRINTRKMEGVILTSFEK